MEALSGLWCWGYSHGTLVAFSSMSLAQSSFHVLKALFVRGLTSPSDIWQQGGDSPSTPDLRFTGIETPGEPNARSAFCMSLWRVSCSSYPLPFSISFLLSSATAAFDLHTLLSLHPQAVPTLPHVGLESLVCSPQQKVSEAVPGRDINQEIRMGRVPEGIRAYPRSPDSPEQDPTLR